MNCVFDIISSIMITFKQQNAIECHGFFSLAVVRFVYVLVCAFFCSFSLYVSFIVQCRCQNKKTQIYPSTCSTQICTYTIYICQLDNNRYIYKNAHCSIFFFYCSHYYFLLKLLSYIKWERKGLLLVILVATNQILTITESTSRSFEFCLRALVVVVVVMCLVSFFFISFHSFIHFL